MIEKIENMQVSNITQEGSTAQPQGSDGSAVNRIDASLQVSSESLIEKAKQPPQGDANIVEQARQLLLSGQLDTPENIEAAAQAIMDLGV